MATRPERIDPDVAFEYFTEGRALFLDARPRAELRERREESRERIPGALHVDPGTGAKLDEELLRVPRDRLIVAYCDEPAEAASAQVARRARALGLGDASVLAGGFRAWMNEGLPIERVPLAAEERGGS